MASFRCTFSSKRAALPASISDRSRRVSIWADRRCPEARILFTYSAYRSSPRRPNGANRIRSENPTMAFNGVRSSWLMFARNSDFARFASTVSVLASCSSCRRRLVSFTAVSSSAPNRWKTIAITAIAISNEKPATEPASQGGLRSTCHMRTDAAGPDRIVMNAATTASWCARLPPRYRCAWSQNVNRPRDRAKLCFGIDQNSRNHTSHHFSELSF